MGGHIFTRGVASGHPVLQTPRMSLEKYNELKKIYVQRVSTFFPKAASVEVGIEAPEKQDYGDVDIIVFDRGYVSWAEAAEAVGAVAWIKRGRDDEPSCSLAVRLDGERSTQKPVEYVCPIVNDPQAYEPDSGVSEQDYAQIDINQIDPKRRNWCMFASSYGDLEGILGKAIFNFGFSINDRGLRLRLQEYDDAFLEQWNHFNPGVEEGRIRLSDDPIETMQVLGLDVERYKAGFKSTKEIFKWLTGCKMVSKYSLKRMVHLRTTREDKNNDKGKNRVMYELFFKDWLPAHLEAHGAAGETSDASLVVLRKKYTNEALNFFNKREEWLSIEKVFLRKRGNIHAAHELQKILQAHTGKEKVTDLVKSFRRNVALDQYGHTTILDHARPDDQSELYTLLDTSGTKLQDPDNMIEFVKTSCDRVKELERARAKERSAADVVLKGFDQAHQKLRDLVQYHVSGHLVTTDTVAEAWFNYTNVFQTLTDHAIVLPILPAKSAVAADAHATNGMGTNEA